MKLYKQKLLSDTQLKKLGEHKYSCQSVSFLDKLLQPYWCWLVLKVPIWLAPNLITVLGLCVNIFTSLLLIWYSPDAKAEAPRWVCALCALGLFIYQSLDAIDGKQARRTNSSNPLGELFDHGCDSISTVFVALSACTAVQLGYYPGWMFFQCFCAMTLFYCAHWQTYVSGTLRFGKVDVTEAQFTIIGILLISSIFGPTVWSTKVTLLGIDIFMAHAMSTAFYLGYLQVFLSFIERLKIGGIGKNGSTIAGTSVLSPVIPFSMVLVPAFIIYKKSTQEIYQNHPALYILAFGLVAAKVTNRLVVAHMTKSEMDYMDWSLMGPAMLFLNQYFNTFINEYYVLWLCLIWVAIDLLRYCSQICHEICDSLHLELFKIPYPGGPMRSYVSSSASVEKNGHNEKRFESDDEDIRPLLKDEEEV
ncbi:choline/ethanolaminephosphotransferase 1 isoform X4 [Diabrotica virgifera virgifera]|uniref:Cholinephosphotransferase 1 n=1 Tax=Diabrotica virgifera virgifera TaxID=50390 RepID=A0ABM5K1P7_DIAVI|nr:choline/ethanolaminephosphotransferase 1 isoform X4 [Diabrotica virgifera virgifera]